jgi:hypothetical protein
MSSSPSQGPVGAGASATPRSPFDHGPQPRQQGIRRRRARLPSSLRVATPSRCRRRTARVTATYSTRADSLAARSRSMACRKSWVVGSPLRRRRFTGATTRRSPLRQRKAVPGQQRRLGSGRRDAGRAGSRYRIPGPWPCGWSSVASGRRPARRGRRTGAPCRLRGCRGRSGRRIEFVETLEIRPHRPVPRHRGRPRAGQAARATQFFQASSTQRRRDCRPCPASASASTARRCKARGAHRLTGGRCAPHRASSDQIVASWSSPARTCRSASRQAAPWRAQDRQPVQPIAAMMQGARQRDQVLHYLAAGQRLDLHRREAPAGAWRRIAATSAAGGRAHAPARRCAAADRRAIRLR